MALAQSCPLVDIGPYTLDRKHYSCLGGVFRLLVKQIIVAAASSRGRRKGWPNPSNAAAEAEADGAEVDTTSFT